MHCDFHNEKKNVEIDFNVHTGVGFSLERMLTCVME